MYFKNVELFDFSKRIKLSEDLLGHTKEDARPERLEEHLDLTYKYLIKICKEKNLDKCFINLENELLKNCSCETKELWKELIANAVYIHDIGKINTDFQAIRMNNEKFKVSNKSQPNHSMLSSILYFDYYLKKIQYIKGEESYILLFFLTINSYVISKHHGYLSEFNTFVDKFWEQIYNYTNNYKQLFCDIYKEELFINEKNIINIMNRMRKYIESTRYNELLSSEIYIYVKLIFSTIVSTDFYATYDFNIGKEVDDFGIIKDVNKFFDSFKSTSIYKNIQKHKEYLKTGEEKEFEDNDINKLRSEMFIEAENNLLKNADKDIFYLEAPTGSGKTNTSINLTLKLLEIDKSLNKIIYIFPFNTLVDQTQKSLMKAFNNMDDIKKEISVINSITPIETIKNSDNEEIDFDTSLLNRQFIHFPFILTTHVNLFGYLFGTSKEQNFPLMHLANSVIVLDEIQSYKNNIWKEIIIFLEKYAKLLNIKIIIMSATLPKLEQLGVENNNCAYLIENRSKYYEDCLFKNRVEPDFSLLLKDNSEIEDIIEKVIDESKRYEKILIEFIKKKSAIQFYKELIEIEDTLEHEIILITGDDNKIERRNIIEKVKEKDKKVILISTQVIEAGVDIDMDIGFKDISILDSEEQFLGRINRSCKKTNSKVYFFDLDKTATIYKGDFRKQKQLTLVNDNIKEIFKSKDFEKYYEKVMKKIDEDKKMENKNNINYFMNEVVGILDMKEIKNKLKLIDERYDEVTLFMNTTIELENKEILYGRKVWDEYKGLVTNKNMGYAEKRIKLSEIMEKVDYFTYKVNKFEDSYNDSIGKNRSILYIEDAEKYFTEGKFDRDNFNKDISFEIIS